MSAFGNLISKITLSGTDRYLPSRDINFSMFRDELE